MSRELTLSERIERARLSLSRGVKTRDVGTCELCGGYTSSGMDKLCYKCANAELADIVRLVDAPPAAAPTSEKVVLHDARSNFNPIASFLVGHGHFQAVHKLWNIVDNTLAAVRADATATLPEVRECMWMEDDNGIYETSCGHSWFFDTGTAAENKAKFCPYCGALLIDKTVRARQGGQHG